MKSTIAFKSKHNNHCLYDFNYSSVLLLCSFYKYMRLLVPCIEVACTLHSMTKQEK